MATCTHEQRILPVRKTIMKTVIFPTLLLVVLLSLTGGKLIEASAATPTAVLVGAGDISSCGNDNDAKTALLLSRVPGTVFTIGDNVYQSGTSRQFTTCYNPTWGKYKRRTMPVPGNHDYVTSGAAGYFNYFHRAKYYAYNRGAWRIYALNSEIDTSTDSVQVRWLKADLARYPKKCVMAYWHRPRWSSGNIHGSDQNMQIIWAVLFDANAELVINGHEHNYERFAPMNESGQSVTNGLREIVAGTGGESHYGFGRILSASQARNSNTYGVLKLTLHPTGYDWKFIPVAGSSYTDSGSTDCH
jgi:calcineurin-like phosphoesterase family protein